jgi:vacuolar protein 8
MPPPPPRRNLKKLVRKLGMGSPPDEREQALAGITEVCLYGHPEFRVAITAAGAIPLLVRLLRPDLSGGVHSRATSALGALAWNPHNKGTIAAAGAIPLLVRLLGPGSSADTQSNSSLLIGRLAEDDETAINTITAAGAIPALAQLLGPSSTDAVHVHAAGALKQLAQNYENAVAIASAGAIPPLVQLLGLGNAADVQERAAGVICDLAAAGHGSGLGWDGLSPGVALANAIVAAGAIPPLVQLLGVNTNAAAALASIAMYAEHAAGVAEAGAIPLLVQLLGPGFDDVAQENAAGVMINLVGHDHSWCMVMVTAGAIPALVQLTRSGSTDSLKQIASEALERIRDGLSRSRAATAVPL